LQRLGFVPRRDADDIIVTPPSYRFDLTMEEDFVEELARLYGYDNIPAAPMPHVSRMLARPEAIRDPWELRRRLIGRDYQEVVTFSFVDSAWEAALRVESHPIKVLNPMTNQLDVMRSTMLGGLL